MKSQPVYPPLAWDGSGRQHLLFVSEGEGVRLAGHLLENPPPGPVAVLYAQAADAQPALRLLDGLLAQADMGCRVYAAAGEGLLWQVAERAERHGLGRDALRLQRLASAARPVSCVHCRALTPQVTSNLVACAGCGRTLFVRDHFSRRLGAYMGVQVDAEAPGECPPLQELYP